MPIPGVEQPRLLPVGPGLRLRRYDGPNAVALGWYQNGETVWLVDGVRTPYDRPRLEQMYAWLDARGELYWIEQADKSGRFAPIGDVTFWQQDMPIVIGETAARGQGVGSQVVRALIDRGRGLGYRELYVNEIYTWNTASRRLFEAAGFCAYEQTARGARYRLRLEPTEPENML